jgi:large subunit ribosomal protein L2
MNFFKNSNYFIYVIGSYSFFGFNSRYLKNSHFFRIISSSGRNIQGKITVYHRGGRKYKSKYKVVSFSYNKFYSVFYYIWSICYDNQRTSWVAFLVNIPITVGFICSMLDTYFVIAPLNIVLGQGIFKANAFVQKPKGLVCIGDSLPLYQIPIGTLIHNIEFSKYSGGSLVRSAGSYAQIVQKKSMLVAIKLPSGVIVWLPQSCFCSVGIVSNINSVQKKLYKAGNNRWLSKRPKVRGVAMNPIDHPHGGGEGKTSGGKPAVSPWGRFVRSKTVHIKLLIYLYFFIISMVSFRLISNKTCFSFLCTFFGISKFSSTKVALFFGLFPNTKISKISKKLRFSFERFILSLVFLILN